jgi:type IV pilus assembly protein PilN
MQITLNLATRPYIDIRPALKRLRIVIAVLAVLCLGLCLGLHSVHRKAEEARATEQSVQNQINAINAERQGYQGMMNQPDNVQLMAHIGELNRLIDEKTFSWTLAMEDLEIVLPAGVQVTSIEPVRDVKSGAITLKLRVVGPRDRAVDLVQNLERSRHFLAPRIVGESSESTGGSNVRLEPISASNRVNFDLLAEYNPAAPMDLNLRAERRPEGEKPLAAGKIVGGRAPAPAVARPASPTAMHPNRPPSGLEQQPGRASHAGAFSRRSLQNSQAKPNSKPNPGGAR